MSFFTDTRHKENSHLVWAPLRAADSGVGADRSAGRSQLAYYSQQVANSSYRLASIREDKNKKDTAQLHANIIQYAYGVCLYAGRICLVV